MKRLDKIREMTATLNKESSSIPGISFSEGTMYYMIWVDLIIPYQGPRITPKQIDLISKLLNVRYDKRKNGFPIDLIGREAASYIIKSSFFLMTTKTNFTLNLRSAESTPNPIESETHPNPSLPDQS